MTPHTLGIRDKRDNARSELKQANQNLENTTTLHDNFKSLGKALQKACFSIDLIGYVNLPRRPMMPTSEETCEPSSQKKRNYVNQKSVSHMKQYILKEKMGLSPLHNMIENIYYF